MAWSYSFKVVLGQKVTKPPLRVKHQGDFETNPFWQHIANKTFKNWSEFFYRISQLVLNTQGYICNGTDGSEFIVLIDVITHDMETYFQTFLNWATKIMKCFHMKKVG